MAAHGARDVDDRLLCALLDEREVRLCDPQLCDATANSFRGQMWQEGLVVAVSCVGEWEDPPGNGSPSQAHPEAQSALCLSSRNQLQ